MRRPLLVLGLLSLGGCAYFNGVYNARAAQKSGDKFARAGQEDAARGAYLTAASKAETVLVRHRKTRWRPLVLYIAGRGAALGGDCEHGSPRLREYLALDGQPAPRRANAQVALASCELRVGRPAEARAILEPLVGYREREISRAASLWAARAAIQLGDADAATRYLGNTEAGAADWELLGASLEAGGWVRAESLLLARAQHNDYRPSALSGIDQLWAARRYDEAERVAWAYDGSRTPARSKVAMHLRLADLDIAAGRRAEARRHLLSARRLGVGDEDHEAEVRLRYLALAEAATFEDVGRLLLNDTTPIAKTSLFRRMRDAYLLATLLHANRDVVGAGTFLTAEVLRDSLGAGTAARTLFRSIEQDAPRSPLVPMAILAAGNLGPADSAEAARARVRGEFAGTPSALLLEGQDPAGLPAWRIIDEQLRGTWDAMVTRFKQEVAKRQAGAPASGTPPLPGQQIP